MTPDDRAQAIFGGFDGLSSALGVILALAVSGSLHGLILASVALAVGSSVSMASGEWLSDEDGSPRRAVAMGLATGVGSLAPALPFIVFSGAVAGVVCGGVVLGLGVLIARLRPGGWISSLGKTFGVLTIATGLALGASMAAGSLD